MNIASPPLSLLRCSWLSILRFESGERLVICLDCISKFMYIFYHTFWNFARVVFLRGVYRCVGMSFWYEKINYFSNLVENWWVGSLRFYAMTYDSNPILRSASQMSSFFSSSFLLSFYCGCFFTLSFSCRFLVIFSFSYLLSIGSLLYAFRRNATSLSVQFLIFILYLKIVSLSRTIFRGVARNSWLRA